MIRSNPTPNPRGFKTIPVAADHDARLDRTAVGLLAYLLGVPGDKTITLDGLQEAARTLRINEVRHAPFLLRLLEGRREVRRVARSLAMLESAGYVDLAREGRRAEVVDAREEPFDA